MESVQPFPRVSAKAYAFPRLISELWRPEGLLSGAPYSQVKMASGIAFV